MPVVSVFMDVEDVINLRSDDAALDVANMFNEVGVTGSFCITGEKCRTLLARDRHDVIEAYSPHNLGLHTDTHSKHPTTMELLETCTYEEGCKLAYDSQRIGYDSFVEAFGRDPKFWGGAGNTWSIEISDAIRRLGFPVSVYSLPELDGKPILKLNGNMHMPHGLYISELEWADDNEAAKSVAKVFKVLESTDSPWMEVFIGHPTKLRHKEYWDRPFFKGRTPEVPEETEPLPAEIYERSLKNQRSFLIELKKRFPVQGVSDYLASRQLEWRKPTALELESFRTITERNLRGAANWPVHYPDMNADNMVQKCLDFASTLEIAVIK